MFGRTSTSHKAAAGFLRAFRRRSLLAAALRLSLFAAIANEAVRWLAVPYNSLFGTALPALSVGLPVFALTFAFTLRRWSMQSAARKADRILSLKDRLASYLDFSRRHDIPPALIRAQAAETGRALAGVTAKRAVPIGLPLYGAPLLLVASIVWPHLWSGQPGRPPLLLRSDRQESRETGDGQAPPSSPSQTGTAHQSPQMTGGAGEASDERDAAGETVPDELRGPPLAGLDSAEEEPEPAGKRSAPRSGVERNTPPESKRVGDRLSPVVDPLYRPGSAGESGSPELPGGSMTFPLLPEAVGGSGATGAAAGSDAGRVIVDFDNLPERYRIIVERYFLLLAGETGKREKRGEHPRAGSGAGKGKETE